MSKIEEQIEGLVSKTINDLGYSIYDVMYVKEGKDYYLRIFIDSEKGISLDDCEKVNDAISDMLDEANYIKEQYFLEISSSGIERHIRNDKQLELNLNERVSIKLFKPIDNKKELEGVLDSFDSEEININIDNEKVSIPRKNISSMKRAFEWS